MIPVFFSRLLQHRGVSALYSPVFSSPAPFLSPVLPLMDHLLDQPEHFFISFQPLLVLHAVPQTPFDMHLAVLMS